MDGGLASRLKQFDAYPKTLEDFRVKTFGGAVGKLLLFNNPFKTLFRNLFICVLIQEHISKKYLEKV